MNVFHLRRSAVAMLGGCLLLWGAGGCSTGVYAPPAPGSTDVAHGKYVGDDWEVAAVAESGALEQVQLVTPAGALRSNVASEELPYVWRGAPLDLLLELAPGSEGRVVARWFDPEGRLAGEASRELTAPTERLRLEGPRTEDLGEGTHELVVSYQPSAQGAPGGEVRLEFGVGDAPAATIDPGDTPVFPWPPPDPATRDVIEADRLGAGGAPPRTLGEATDRLLAALDASGYFDHSFYAIRPGPGPTAGVALVTRLEQMRPDGAPLDGEARWSVELPPRDFSIDGLVRALFTAPEGHYRVIVFLLTDLPVVTSDEEPTREEAGEWLGRGLPSLPSALADRPWTRDHACTALIYQFRQVGVDREPEVNPPGAPPAHQQLDRAGILPALPRGGSGR